MQSQRVSTFFRRRDGHPLSVGQEAVLLARSQRLGGGQGSQSKWSFLVVPEENPVRIAWNSCLVFFLAYTAIVLPFKLAFIDFGIPEKSFPKWHRFFEVFVVDLAFCIDLVANFFFSYRDERGREVWDLHLIAKKYLQTHFVIDFIACIPPPFFSWCVCNLVSSSTCTDTDANQAGRWFRLQRVSRMARLARLARLYRLGKCLQNFKFWEHVRGWRGVRAVNQCFGLLFTVHLVACGWWICAALHDNPRDTWIHRRELGEEGHSVYELSAEGEYSALSQWTTSMYFTLTIFTTVGFGDMSAYTTVEMWYACFAMIMGCMVNGIILSEVISILTTVNEGDQQRREAGTLIRSFAKHMHVTHDLTEELVNWITSKRTDDSQNYNHDAVKDLLVSGILPRQLFDILPHSLFDGQLVRNRFVCGSLYQDGPTKLPPRFPVMVALACDGLFCEKDQIVYYIQDGAWNVYMVMTGVFSYVTGPAHATAKELDMICMAQGLLGMSTSKNSDGADDTSPYQLFSHGNYFGDLELVLHSCPRISTARCESPDGATLVLHKSKLFSLIEEFPHITPQWRHAAKRRARQRDKMMARSRPGSYKDLAARMLQRSWRYILAKRNGKCKCENDVEIYRATVDGMDGQAPNASKKGISNPFHEHVPHYVRIIHDQIERVQKDVDQMRDNLSGEVKEIKRILLSNGHMKMSI